MNWKTKLMGGKFFQVGSDPSLPQSGHPCLILPPGPFLFPHHCTLAHTLDPTVGAPIVTITPSNRDAETFVNQKRIFDTTILQVSKSVIAAVKSRDS